MSHTRYSPSLLLLAVASSASAAISINIEADLLKDKFGTALSKTSLFLLVASSQDSTFGLIQGGVGTSVGSILNGTDDIVLFRGTLESFNKNGVLEAGGIVISFDDARFNGQVGSGDPVALVWLPNTSSATTMLPGGSAYGIYTNPTAVDGSRAFVLPSNGSSSYNLTFHTQDGGDFSGPTASNQASAGLASLTVVPEPSSALLVIFGAVALSTFRRRRVA